MSSAKAEQRPSAGRVAVRCDPSASGEESCDGVHPETGEDCVRQRHNGCHQTLGGLHWLDD